MKKFISLLSIVAILATSLPILPVHADDETIDVRAEWEETIDTIPDSVSYSLYNSETNTEYKNFDLNKNNGWKETISFKDDWVNPQIKLVSDIDYPYHIKSDMDSSTITYSFYSPDEENQGEKTYHRIIKYRDKDTGVALRDAEVQTVTMDSDGQWVDGSIYEKLYVPAIDGYTSETIFVDEFDVSKYPEDLRNQNIDVYYKAKGEQYADVIVTFVDISNDPQDLSRYTHKYRLRSDLGEQADISNILLQLQNKNYKVPAMPRINSKTPVVTINVDHTYEQNTETKICPTYVVDLVFPDDENKNDTWKINEEGAHKVTTVIDKVTGKSEVQDNDSCLLNPVSVPTFDGYTSDVKIIIGEDIPDEITYYPINEDMIKVSFEDINDQPQDLSSLTQYYDSGSYDSNAILQLLDSNNFTLKSELPETLDKDIVLKVDHKYAYSEDNPIDRTYKRVVHFVDENQSPIAADYVETITHHSHTNMQEDLVTGKRSIKDYTNYWVDDIDSFGSVELPYISGYAAPGLKLDPITIDNMEKLNYDETIVYKTLEENNNRTIEVVFKDINENAQNLKEYNQSIEVDFTGIDSYAVPEIDSTIKKLEELGYVITQRDEVTKDNLRLEILVDHQVKESSSDKTISGTRTINFIGVTRDPIFQTTDVTETDTLREDLVTGEIVTSNTTYSGKYLAYDLPELPGYKKITGSIEEQEIDSIDDLSVAVDVEYAPTEEVETKDKVSVKFVDKDGADLSAYTLDVEVGSEVSLTEARDKLIALGYTLPEGIGDTLLVTENKTIEVLHNTETKTESTDVEVKEIINFEGVDRDPEEIVTTAKAIRTMVIDATTGEVIKTSNKIEGMIDTYVAPKIEGYAPDPEKIDPIDLSTISLDDNKVITKTITYTPRFSYNKVKVTFVDRNKNSSDLSTYDKEFILNNHDLKIDLSGWISELEDKGYQLLTKDVPVNLDGTKDEYILNFDHKTNQTETVEEIPLYRMIKFDGVEHEEIKQELTAKRIRQVTEDLVTHETTEYVDIEGIFPEYPAPKIDKYIISGSDAAPTLVIDTEEELTKNFEYTFHYAKDPEQNDMEIRFVDVNEVDSQDLSEYTKHQAYRRNFDPLEFYQSDVTQLESAGYSVKEARKIDDFTYEIDLVHGTKVTTNVEEQRYLRRIILQDNLGNVIREIDQVAYADTETTNNYDLVLHTVKIDVERYAHGTLPSSFTEYTVPTIPGYTTDMVSIPSMSALDLESSDIETVVTYHTDKIQEVKEKSMVSRFLERIFGNFFQ